MLLKHILDNVGDLNWTIRKYYEIMQSAIIKLSMPQNHVHSPNLSISKKLFPSEQ